MGEKGVQFISYRKVVRRFIILRNGFEWSELPVVRYTSVQLPATGTFSGTAEAVFEVKSTYTAARLGTTTMALKSKFTAMDPEYEVAPATSMSGIILSYKK